jgi:hypothetical protein
MAQGVLVTVEKDGAYFDEVETDEDGFFGFSFHHKGKETPYQISATGYASETVYLKAGRLAEVELTLP